MVNIFSNIVLATPTNREVDIIDAFNEQIGSSYVEQLQLEEHEVEQKTYCEATVEDEFLDNEILVVLSKEQSALKQDYTISDFSEISLENVYVLYDYYPEDQNNIILSLMLSNEGKQNVLNAIDILEQDARIISAEPNFKVEVTPFDIVEETENIASTFNIVDERIPNLYTYACCARKYIDSNKNRAVKVGIVDTGIFNNLPGAYEKVVQYVDCRKKRENNEDTYLSGYETPYDLHGTNVAKVIAKSEETSIVYNYDECGNNVYCGTCPNVELYSLLTFYPETEGLVDENYTDYFINALNYASKNNIKILNISCEFRCLKNYSSNVITSWNTAINNYSGIIVTAAGNEDKDPTKSLYVPLDLEELKTGSYQNIEIFPITSEADNVIVVGASEYINMQGEHVLTNYSKYGQTIVDLTTSGRMDAYGYDSNWNVITATDDATSWAAPRVAGAAAVLLNINPDLTAAQIKHYIMAGVDKSSALTDKCVSGGSLNIYRSAKMLIADMACNWQTVFAGHFTDLNNMQVAAYCKGGGGG